jgi:cytoskeletal protein RodZ
MSEAAPESRPAVVVGSGGVGPALRAARERRALSVGAVTETLHIESRIIEAMEAGRFNVFDAPVYARGFIRKYGTFLELPVDDLIAAYDSLASGPAAPSMIPVTEASAPPRDYSVLKVAAAFVLLLLFVGGSYWWWLGRAPPPPPPAIDAVAAAPAPAQTTPAAPAAAQSTEPSPSRAAAVAARPAQRAGAARAVASGAALVVTGLRECWVEVYAPSGARLLYDLVQAGDSRTLPGPGPWRMFLGNADAVRLSMEERTIAVPAANRAGATARLVVMADGAVK